MFTFNVLPLHPAPYSLESFTGYLTRLAQENQITSISGLSALVFPTLKRKANWTDYPRASYGALPEATCCSIEQIQATTFYHLAAKFNRREHHGVLATFLSETIASHWRCCSLCLAEHGYTNLLWRFKDVIGCPEHGVRLLDVCPVCAATIPLISSRLRLSTCPCCRADIRLASCIRLTDTESHALKAVVKELRFLLLPQTWEAKEEVAHGLGPFLAARRHEQGWTSEVMALRLRISPYSMGGMDGRSGGRGENFLTYKRYLEALGLSFQDAFSQLAHGQPTPGQVMLKAVQEVSRQLIDAQQPVTLKALCDAVGKSAHTLRRFPEVRAFLANNTVSLRTAADQQMLERVKHIVEQLRSDGRALSPAAVAEQCGLKENSLRHYQQTWAFLKQQIPAKTTLTEEEALACINQAIRRLNETGQRLSQAKLCAEAGLSLYFLNVYPAVRERLAELNLYASDSSFALHEDDLLARVQEAIQQLRLAGQPINQISIAHHLGMGNARVTGGLTVKAYIHAAAKQEAARRRVQTEQTLMVRLTQLIHELQRTGQPVLRKTAAQHLGVSLPTLRNYPEVDALLRTAKTLYKTNRTALYEQVQATVHTLRQRGEPVTQRQVARLLGTSTQRLAHYPEIVDFLQRVADVSAHQQQAKQEREAQLRQQVLQTIQDLKTRGEPLNQRTIARALNTSAQCLKAYVSIRPILSQVAWGKAN